MKQLDMNFINSLKIILEIRELIVLNNDLKSTAFEVSFRFKWLPPLVFHSIINKAS